MTQSLWKNNLIIAKDVKNVHVYFIVTVIRFSEKKLEALLSYCPSYIGKPYFARHHVLEHS
jgi:hypothetical protein